MSFTVTFKAALDMASVECTFPPGTVTATVADLEELIQLLSTIRAQLQPPVSMDPPLDVLVDPLPDPRYWTNYDQMTEGTLLGVRHPGLGWIWSLLPPVECERLIGYLQKHREAQLRPKTPN